MLFLVVNENGNMEIYQNSCKYQCAFFSNVSSESVRCGEYRSVRGLISKGLSKDGEEEQWRLGENPVKI